MELHTLSLFYMMKTMVTSQWLEEAVAYADQQYLLCQQQRKQHNDEADEEADKNDKNIQKIIQLKTTVKLPQCHHKDNWCHKS